MWLEQKSLSIKFPNPFLFPIGRFLVLHLRKIVLIFSCCKGFPFKPRQSLSYLKMKQTLIKIKNKKDFPAFESFAPKARDLGSIPGQGTRSHILQLRCWMPQLRPCMCVGVSHSVCVCVCVCVCVLVIQLCPTLCNPIDYSPPGSSVHGILQARILEWVWFPSSRGSSQPRDLIQGSPALKADSLPSEPPGKSMQPYI